MSIGENLKKWRAHKHLKQDEASALLRVPFSTYQKYEMGISKPGAEAIEAFINAGINANWLLTGKGPMLTEQDRVTEVKAEYAPARQAKGLDMERLQIAIETIEEALDEENCELEPATKAECIKLAYLILEEESKDKDQGAYAHAQQIITRLVKSMG